MFCDTVRKQCTTNSEILSTSSKALAKRTIRLSARRKISFIAIAAKRFELSSIAVHRLIYIGTMGTANPLKVNYLLFGNSGNSTNRLKAGVRLIE